MDRPGPAATVDLSPLLRPLGGDRPAYVALADRLRSLILDGRLPLRVRLPSERDLARILEVSRTTASSAYDVLRAEGYLESRQGSGTRVALPTAGANDQELPGPVPHQASGGGIDLTLASLPAPGAMIEAIRGATEALAAHLGGFGYDPRGVPSLRREVAGWFTGRGVPTDEDQVVITSGAQNALRLLLEVLVGPGDAALVEVPTYPHAIEAVQRVGGRPLPLAMREDGWDLDRLAARLDHPAPRVAYLVPDFQNPTGLLMRDDERSAVVEAVSGAGVHLVVDETFVRLDLEPWRAAPRPMAGHDPDDRVITIGSMSKAYWGGLRVGWIRCRTPVARRVAQARASVDLATAVLEQLVAEQLLRAGDAVMAERRTMLRSRREALAAALGQELPGWRFRLPRGGLCLWVELDGGDAETLAEVAGDEGVRVVPGSRFGLDGSLEHRVRLPFTQPEGTLVEAVARLARAARRMELGARGRAPVVVT